MRCPLSTRRRKRAENICLVVKNMKRSNLGRVHIGLLIFNFIHKLTWKIKKICIVKIYSKDKLEIFIIYNIYNNNALVLLDTPQWWTFKPAIKKNLVCWMVFYNIMFEQKSSPIQLTLVLNSSPLHIGYANRDLSWICSIKFTGPMKFSLGFPKSFWPGLARRTTEKTWKISIMMQNIGLLSNVTFGSGENLWYSNSWTYVVNIWLWVKKEE